MSISPTRRCPCHSGRVYKRCCLPLHEGRPAPSPAALMRSRYAAYALGLADYIIRTTHRDSPHWERDTAAWTAAVQTFCTQTRFISLRVLTERLDGAEGEVSFHAGLERNGQDVSFGERSRFVLQDGRWLYVEGVRLHG